MNPLADLLARCEVHSRTVRLAGSRAIRDVLVRVGWDPVRDATTEFDLEAWKLTGCKPPSYQAKAKSFRSSDQSSTKTTREKDSRFSDKTARIRRLAAPRTHVLDPRQHVISVDIDVTIELEDLVRLDVFGLFRRFVASQPVEPSNRSSKVSDRAAVCITLCNETRDEEDVDGPRTSAASRPRGNRPRTNPGWIRPQRWGNVTSCAKR
jgi:hypothetical protein